MCIGCEGVHHDRSANVRTRDSLSIRTRCLQDAWPIAPPTSIGFSIIRESPVHSVYACIAGLQGFRLP